MAGLYAYRAFVCQLCTRWSVSHLLFLLVSGTGYGFFLWLFLDFSVCLFATPDCLSIYLVNAESLESCSVYSETGFTSEQLFKKTFVVVADAEI